MNRLFIQTNELPECIRAVLNRVEYRKKDIAVSPATTYQVNDSGWDGRKAFTAVVNMQTGESNITWGSWGGPNMFNPQNKVDMDDSTYPIPMNGAVVKGSIGNQTWASVMVHPENITKLLPKQEELTSQEKSALRIVVGIKGGNYRKEEFSRAGLGPYDQYNPFIMGLENKGMVKINRAGAVTATTKGKNHA